MFVSAGRWPEATRLRLGGFDCPCGVRHDGFSVDDPWASRFPFPGWELLNDEEARKLRKRLGRRFQGRLLRFRASRWEFPWEVSYDIGRALYVAYPDKTPDIWGHTYDLDEPGPHFDALIADLYEKSLAVVLELTEPDGFTYAWGDHAMLKFWPQRAERRQLALEIPQPFTDGDLHFGDSYFASDFSWGFQLQAIEALLFGQALIDAFERHKPRVFLEPRPPQPKRKLTKEQQAEIDADRLFLILGMNVGTLKAEGLWTPELQSLFDSCMAGESQSRDDHAEDRVRKDLAKLIALTQTRLKEHNIQYTSARDVL